MPYQLKIDPMVMERYPGYSVLVIYAHGLSNGPGNASSTALLRSAEQQQRASLTLETLASHPHIEAWRQAYKSFGVKPKKYPCSLEALLSRTLKGYDLPTINRLVDLYNAISLKYMLPVGGEDWEQLSSDLILSIATGSEPFVGIQEGQEVVTYPEPGEIIWADSTGVTCRRWNWRQCRRTQLTIDTHEVYFVLDRLVPYSIRTLQAAGEDLINLLKQMCPGCAITPTLLGAQAE